MKKTNMVLGIKCRDSVLVLSKQELRKEGRVAAKVLKKI